MYKFRYPLFALALLYFLLLRDVIPDYRFPWGWIDDLIVFAFVLRKMSQWEDDYLAKQTEELRKKKRKKDEPKKPPKTDPYEVLGVTESSTKSEVQEAYRKLIAQYHPDKVHHLGEELQEIARKKSLEINQAYETLLKDLNKDKS